LTYSSTTDALKHVLAEGGRVTRTPSKVACYRGGPYYFVEVTSRTGTVYALDAVGTEAFDLERTVNAKID
jgi:hypothetical protein